MKRFNPRLLMLAVLLPALFLGCSTLSVKAPKGMYLSMGDYTANVRTEGIVQAYRRAWTPFVVLYDASKIREKLYEELINKVEKIDDADGITNITFYSKPSPLSVLAPFTFGLGIWMDYYAEGVVIQVKE